ncbi:MAG: YfhO family protein [Butyrivibrio sp.]|nr:YfhO family protein [Butyrivibrio sp.]
MTEKEKIGKITGLKSGDRRLFLILCILTALIPMLYPEIAGKGFYFIADDFNNQMLPFLFNFRDAFANGLNTYYWNYDLGTPMVYGYGYYGIGSIFYYPVFLVPRALMPYMVLVIMMLKYLTACFTSFLFVKRYTKTPKGAIPGALLYAFSGLQCTNIVFYCFHDVSAVFPLMLLALDVLIKEKDRKKSLYAGIMFSLATAINCLTNYVFFVQSVVAVIIYFLFISEKTPMEFVKKTVMSAVFGVLGVGLSSVIYVPNILYIMGNERSDVSVTSNFWFYDLKTLLYIVKGLLLPGDIMLDESALLDKVWLSTSAYLPFVGLALVFAFIIKNRKDKLSVLTIFLLVISFIPVGNGAFLLFTIVYHRWWYFLILLMAAMSCIVLENPDEYRIDLGTGIQLILIGALTVAVFLIRQEGESLVWHKGRFLMLVTFAAACDLALGCFFAIKKKGRIETEKFKKLVIAGIVVSSIITTLYAEYFYRAASPVEPSDYVAIYEAGSQMPDPGENYRFRNYRNPVVMYNTSDNAAGLSSYSSTTSNSIIQFDEIFGWWDVSRRTNKSFLPGAAELLAGRYLILTDADTEERYPDYILEMREDGTVPVQSFEAGGKKFDVYELDACPIGYAAKGVISYSELEKLPVDERGIALLAAAAVPDEEVSEYLRCLKEYKASDIQAFIDAYPEYAKGDVLFETPLIKELVSQNREGALESFERDHSGFRAVADYKEDTFVYFSIPYDEGWKVMIDGSPAGLSNSGGMSLMYVGQGRHEIEVTYHLPGLFAGTSLSLISAVILICLGFYAGKEKR